ncbi:MAG: glycosyltransferase family 4 protein [Alphaproteobacteria bacterium]|nr:glycosyltransferase family 4 protein [Alphaproteobacteria bacterium]
MKIIFFCPPTSVVNGGIKHIFRMAEALIAQGREAVVFEQNASRPTWFVSTAPIVGQGGLTIGADHIYVLPEDQPHILADFARLPGRKVVYSQNHFYGALGIAKAESFADYGVTDILCSSRTIYDHCRLRHKDVRAHVVPCAVDPALFKPAERKDDIIVFMPRKRPIEAVYIRDMFRFSHPPLRDWAWQEIANVSEAEVAAQMGKARVFLSLSRLEGFGLTPLEAMASGCVVAGFTGIGGREYASPENGFWAGEDDFPACIQSLAKAVEFASASGAALEKHQLSCRQTLFAYTPEAFQKVVKDAWEIIVGLSEDQK